MNMRKFEKLVDVTDEYGKDNFFMTAQLKNGKIVVLFPDFENGVCEYRYLTDKEIEDGYIYTDNNYWHIILRTSIMCDGINIYCTIEYTDILLAGVEYE